MPPGTGVDTLNLPTHSLWHGLLTVPLPTRSNEKMIMKQALCLVVVAGLYSAPASSPADEPPAGFQPIFNGRDLAGWKVLNGKKSVWGTENGLLVVDGKGGGWLMTEPEYADFEIRLEYKMPKHGNSGVA